MKKINRRTAIAAMVLAAASPLALAAPASASTAATEEGAVQAAATRGFSIVNNTGIGSPDAGVRLVLRAGGLSGDTLPPGQSEMLPGEMSGFEVKYSFLSESSAGWSYDVYSSENTYLGVLTGRFHVSEWGTPSASLVSTVDGITAQVYTEGSRTYIELTRTVQQFILVNSTGSDPLRGAANRLVLDLAEGDIRTSTFPDMLNNGNSMQVDVVNNVVSSHSARLNFSVMSEDDRKLGNVVVALSTPGGGTPSAKILESSGFVGHISLKSDFTDGKLQVQFIQLPYAPLSD